MTSTYRQNIAKYLPVAVFVSLAVFGSPDLKLIFRRALVLSVAAFCWGFAFSALLLDRFIKRHQIQRDGDDLARLLNGSGIFMFNISLFCGFVAEGALNLAY